MSSVNSVRLGTRPVFEGGEAMGISQFVNADKFPRQGSHLGLRVRVIFDRDTAHEIGGTIVRDDVAAPGIGIIRLDSGRYVLMSECQYTFASSWNTKE
jgi:hypothetical protein